MERWTAASDEPKALSQDRVKDCDFCVLLVGFRRGHIPDGETRSITQPENAPGLAAKYVAHLARLLSSYRWRSTMAAARRPTLFSLQQTDKWQQHFFQGTRRSEFNFLFGSLSPGL